MKKPNIIYQQNKKSGVVYAYEDRPYWDTEKKQSRSRRKMLGKVDSVTGEIVPTRRRKTKEPTIQIPEESTCPTTTPYLSSRKCSFFFGCSCVKPLQKESWA